MKSKNTGNGITPSADGKTAKVACGKQTVKVRYDSGAQLGSRAKSGIIEVDKNNAPTMRQHLGA